MIDGLVICISANDPSESQMGVSIQLDEVVGPGKRMAVFEF